MKQENFLAPLVARRENGKVLYFNNGLFVQKDNLCTLQAQLSLGLFGLQERCHSNNLNPCQKG